MHYLHNFKFISRGKAYG